ncbi:hypothetical protein [Halorussus ruber]|uniref:hypothetical protein n=1 Tax=Halorussus ruber TaxID=1126238 RepID=UPI0010919289|nr:hypothetical protein [Halorussus ruber]
MTDTDSFDVATWTLILTVFVVGFLVVTGLLQYAASGDFGSLLRNLAIGALLLAFGAGLRKKWQNE